MYTLLYFLGEFFGKGLQFMRFAVAAGKSVDDQINDVMAPITAVVK